MDFTVKSLPPMRLAAVPHRGPYQQIGPAFRTLGERAAAAGLFARGAGPMLGVYKDDPTATPPDALRSAAGLVIRGEEPLTAGLVEERIDGGRYFSILHKGPYDGLPAAWGRLLTMFTKSGERRRPGPSLEIYLNDPTQVAPADLETELAVPIE